MDDATAENAMNGAVEPMPPEMLAALKAGHDAFVDGLRGQVLANDQQDWEYRSTPFVSTEMFEKLFMIIGESNVVVVSGAQGHDKRGAWSRASFFISPAGVESLNAWASSNASTAPSQESAAPEQPPAEHLTAHQGRPLEAPIPKNEET